MLVVLKVCDLFKDSSQHHLFSPSGVGIRVNSEENQGGGQGQVSIKVGGVNVIVGESDKPSVQLARENLEDEEYFEESDEERDIDPADDVEIGGVVDVFIESVRQIRSLLLG